MQKLKDNRLYNFLTNFKWIDTKQYAVLKNATHALDKVIAKIYNNLKWNKAIVASFIVLNKGFDTVKHQILFNQFKNEGIISLLLELLMIYQ